VVAIASDSRRLVGMHSYLRSQEAHCEGLVMFGTDRAKSFVSSNKFDKVQRGLYFVLFHFMFNFCIICMCHTLFSIFLHSTINIFAFYTLSNWIARHKQRIKTPISSNCYVNYGLLCFRIATTGLL
jgi:hypothetical protein